MWVFNDHFQKNEGFSCSGKVDAANELALLYFKHLKKLKKRKKSVYTLNDSILRGSFVVNPEIYLI